MRTVVEVADRTALVALMQSRLAAYSYAFEPHQLRVQPYMRDERIGWDTHIVTIDGYGVAGFTDGPVEEPPPTPPSLEREEWTPQQALEFYAAGRHFDVVNGRTRIIDTGAIASDALKQLSAEYAQLKGLDQSPEVVPGTAAVLELSGAGQAHAEQMRTALLRLQKLQVHGSKSDRMILAALTPPKSGEPNWCSRCETAHKQGCDVHCHLESDGDCSC